MHCHAFEEKLNQLLDDRRDVLRDAELVAHARACQPCRALLEGSVALVSSVRKLPLPELRSDFSSMVIRATLAAGDTEHAMEAVVVEAPLNTTSRSGNTFAADPTLDAEVMLHTPPHARKRGLGWWALAGATSVAALLLISAGVVMIAARNQNQVAQDNRGEGSGTLGVGMLGPRRQLPVPRAHGSGLAFSVYQYKGAIRNFADQLPVAAQQFEGIESQTPGIDTIRATLWVALDTLLRSMGSSADHPAEQPSYDPAPAAAGNWLEKLWS